MPPSNQPGRRSRAISSSLLKQQFGAMQRSIDQAIQNNRRQQRLRSQRRQQGGSNSQANKEMVALHRAFQFRGLQRWQQRRQRNQQASRNPLPRLWPRMAKALSTREASALLMRHGATALLLLVLCSLIPNAIPIQLLSPNWYLQVLAYVGENVPVLILAAVFALLSLVFESHNKAATFYRTRLLRFSRLGYILALVLVPLQLMFTAWLFGQTFNTTRIQRTAIRANTDALISSANQAANTEQFVAFLRARNINANLQSIAAAPLLQVRSEFIRSVKANQQEQEQKLAEANRTTLLRYATTSTKLLIALVILAGFLRVFQTLVRWCSLQQADSQLLTPPEADSSKEITNSR